MAYQLQEKDLKTQAQWQKYYKDFYLKDWKSAWKSGEPDNWSGETGQSGEDKWGHSCYFNIIDPQGSGMW